MLTNPQPGAMARMTAEEAERILDTVDWDNGRSGEFTRLRWDERQAMIVIVAAYMTGELDADDAAAVLRCDVTDLPPLPGAGSREPGESDDDIQAAWDVEVTRRIQEIDDGTAETFDGEAVMAEMRAWLAAQRAAQQR